MPASAKPFELVVHDLNRAASLDAALRRHFDSFCTQALRLKEPECPVKSISVSRDGSSPLLFRFLGRCVRVSLRMNRQAERGELYVEDISASELDPTREAREVERLSFDANGVTELPGGYTGRGINLGLPQDCLTIALRFLDLTLDQPV